MSRAGVVSPNQGGDRTSGLTQNGKAQQRWPAGTVSVSLFLTGGSNAALVVAIPLFAKDDLAASNVLIALYFAIVAVVGTVVTYVTGLISDRLGDRRRLIWLSLLWIALGRLILPYVTTYSGLVLCGVLFSCTLNVATAQLFAYGHDWTALSDHAKSNSTKRVGLKRVAFSAGSFTGFAAGGVALAYLDYDQIFTMTAAVTLASLAIALSFPRCVTVERQSSVERKTPELDAASRLAIHRLLPAFAGLLVIFASGRMLQISQLPIIVRDIFGAPPEMVGLALSVPPLAELALIPVAAVVAVRFGRGTVFLSGGVCGTLYYASLLQLDSIAMLFLVQLLYALFGAATLMVGIDIAQSLVRERSGLAASTYFAHETIAVVNGSLVAAVSVHLLDAQNAFVVPFVLCLFAVVSCALMFRRYPRHFDFRLVRQRTRIGA